MARRCLFCDKKATTREHAWPGWIARQLGLKGAFLEPQTEVGNIKPRKQMVSIASYRRLMLCKECQEHFKRLEDKVIPILLPMARGEPTPLWAYERAALAEWGAKTAYTVFDFHDLTRDIPEDDRRTLRQTGKPAENVFVGFAPYQGAPRSTFSLLPLDPNRIGEVPAPDAPPIPSAYNYVGAFGRAALKVFGLRDQSPSHVLVATGEFGYQVFPDIGNDVLWPTRPPYVGDDILGLVMFSPVVWE